MEVAMLAEYAWLWAGEPSSGTYGGDHCWFVVSQMEMFSKSKCGRNMKHLNLAKFQGKIQYKIGIIERRTTTLDTHCLLPLTIPSTPDLHTMQK